MLLKFTTILSTALAALRNRQPSWQQMLPLAGIAALFLVWKLYSPAANTPASTRLLPENAKPKSVKWSYDELAHKLIVENADLAYQETDPSFTQEMGKSLSKVTRHSHGKPVIVNL